MAEISSIDHPISALKKADGSKADMLQTESYAAALAKFAMECGTPLTIGVQGEWGSGKTSLLNMMQDIIDNNVGSKGVKGCDVYKSIWVNTWEHSLLKSPEECLLSIIEEIINVIAAVDGSWQTAQKAKAALSMLAKGALRIGTSMALGQEAAIEMGSVLGGSNSVKMLRISLEETIKELIKRPQNSIERFIIFIDDLDRLDPAVAVMILELLKNIFHIDHCVFVLAIDYQVVVKGLKSKFGEPNEQNEWEFRAFFDKIIQLPFMMPMGAYDLNNYVENLLEETSYFNQKEMKVLKSSKLSNIVRLTIGANPRALKRLVNSLSLILIQRSIFTEGIGGEIPKEIKDHELEIKQLLIALVSLQISYPKLYNLLVKYPIFYEWDDAFVNRIVDTKLIKNADLEPALQKNIELNEENFDEEWEQTLFKILWANGWYKNRIIEISKALSIIKDRVLILVSSDEIKGKLLTEALRLTAVTSVFSTEDASSSSSDDDDNKLLRISYWKDFTNNMANTNTSFARKKLISTHSHPSWYVTIDKLENWAPSIEVFASSKVMIRIFTGRNTDEGTAIKLYDWIKHYEKELENETGIKPKFKDSSQSFAFDRPKETVGDLSNQDNKESKTIVFKWLKINVEKIENILEKAYDEYQKSLEMGD